MDILTTLLIALLLAMDASAVAISSGLSDKDSIVKHGLRMALFFGIFQGTMPVLGWLAGNALHHIIFGFDHWIAFGLLIVIGLRMIYESVRGEVRQKIDPHKIYVLLILSLATSIDALAVGISLAFLKSTIVIPAIIIGLVTFTLSSISFFVGNKMGRFFGKKVEIIGGLILIGIGIKILIEHLG